MTEIVRAAGGIVLADADAGADRRVAVVHRPRYDDWSFPKGKLQDGEDERSAAVREVEEETGLRCRLGPSIGAVTYRDRAGRAKVVRYFSMTADGGSFLANAEVDELRWLAVDEAERLLSYEHDRLLLRRALGGVPSAAVYVLRHAKAGTRSRWDGPDDERPLTRRGRKQAARLVELFEGLDLSRIVTSPFVRCVQSVEPLSDARGIPIERSDALGEGVPVDSVLDLVDGLDERPTLLCGHGREIDIIVDHAEASGGRIDGHRGIAKGSVWVLEREHGRFVSARYLPPAPG
ncbi:MAG TPA: NUDIX hydrolase [Actinomycetota bacterium]|nr:NUDIX hydrolase [Actinomycetota bacterium]